VRAVQEAVVAAAADCLEMLQAEAEDYLKTL
jgi:hypothetical protein